MTDAIRNELRRYKYCETPANLSTVGQIITLYEESIRQVIDLLISAEIDVRSNVQQQCPFGATVYDACSDGMWSCDAHCDHVIAIVIM